MVCKSHAGAWSREAATPARSRTDPSVRTITPSDRIPDTLTPDVRAPLTAASLQHRLPDIPALGAARSADEPRPTERRRPLAPLNQVRHALPDRHAITHA